MSFGSLTSDRAAPATRFSAPRGDTIDINRSGTRKEELLLGRDVLARVWILRKLLAQLNPVETMEFVVDKITDTKNNQEFLDSMNQ